MTLRAENIDFAYNSHKVLDHVSLRLRPGRLTGLIGPNGSGKSTLLCCLDRILKPRQGSILLDGRDLTRLSARDLAREVGYVPQHCSQSVAATVGEVVLLGRRPHLRFRVNDRDRRAVKDALDALDLGGLAERYFDELSGGEKQKALVARALAQETRILLLDEPTSNLDLRHQLEVLDLLTGLKESRQLSLAVSLHDLNLAARYADDLVLLHQGRVAALGEPSRVLTPENLAMVYGVQARVNFDSGGRPLIQVIRPLRPEEIPCSELTENHG